MPAATSAAMTPASSVWSPQRKTPADAESVVPLYQQFADKVDQQRQKFQADYLDKLTDDCKSKMLNDLKEVGMWVDFDKSTIHYLPEFKPLDLDYDVCYVRHGKTEGNTEPRIFQGYCDYWENQLNETGLNQAEAAAKIMETELQQFRPDVIVCSPLGRAIETGKAFFKNHPDIPVRIWEGAREQQFGSWDNVQLRYMSDTDVCHLFYLDQNVLVKAPKPHVGSNGVTYMSENFVELVLRQAKSMKDINTFDEIVAKKNAGERGKVLIYGHSMAGAAVSMLLGHGKTWNDKKALGFDGKYIMPNATPTKLPAIRPAFL